jgi:hypothetical protein
LSSGESRNRKLEIQTDGNLGTETDMAAVRHRVLSTILAKSSAVPDFVHTRDRSETNPVL